MLKFVTARYRSLHEAEFDPYLIYFRKMWLFTDVADVAQQYLIIYYYNLVNIT